MLQNKKQNPIKLVVLQRVIKSYRAPLFISLCADPGLDAIVFHGENVPNTKTRGTLKLRGIVNTKIKTRHLKVGKRVLTFHIGLIRKLRELNPDVILCEGESHFIGYLQAMLFRLIFSKKTALLHWCFISLPGRQTKEINHRSLLKAIFRKGFDAFVLYSSYSKDCLVELGQPERKAFVATNVGDVNRFLSLSDSVNESPAQAREMLGLPNIFTVIYVGTLDENKHPEMLLELANSVPKSKYNFILVGTGSIYQKLNDHVQREKLTNVFLTGHVVKELPLYYRAADVLLIPGRGGIVISEAMCFGVPVIVHQADGTEYDLVENNVTGIRVENADKKDFISVLEYLERNPEKCKQMGLASRELIENRFTTDNMVNQIKNAAKFAIEERRRKGYR